MTAEVIIMNQGAIALATDSAVTFQSGKIFNSANKLYMLAPKYPVGILIYNNALLMGKSWELIIKSYRDYLVTNTKRFGELRDYGINLVQFLRDNHALFFPMDYQDSVFESLLNSFLKNDIGIAVSREVERYILQNAKPISDDEILKIVRTTIDNIYDQWNTPQELFDNNKVNEITLSMEKRYRQTFETQFQNILGIVEQKGLEAEYKNKLWETCINWFKKDWWFFGQFSGVCVAGYGEDEIYSSFSEYYFESYLADTLKYKEQQYQTASQFSGIFPFAQSDIINMVVSGVHQYAWEGLTDVALSELTNTYKQVLQQNSAQSSTDIDKQASQLAEGNIIQIIQELKKLMRNQYVTPIMDIVQGLPKDELALMAETLVNTTSYMRRVSDVKETVGGPTDVAVISKKDGFVWIKRKHYFDADINYHFFDN